MKKKNHPADCWEVLTEKKEKKQKDEQKEEDWNRLSSSLAFLADRSSQSKKIQQETWQQNETVHCMLKWFPVRLNWLMRSVPKFKNGKIHYKDSEGGHLMACEKKKKSFLTNLEVWKFGPSFTASICLDFQVIFYLSVVW